MLGDVLVLGVVHWTDDKPENCDNECSRGCKRGQ